MDSDTTAGSRPSEPRAQQARLARAAGLVGSLTLLSRVLGLAREQLFAALLGAGFHSDAYQIAYRIPNLLRDLFAEGALSAAFVPTFTESLSTRGRQAAYLLANRLKTLLLLVLGVVTLAGILFSHELVKVLAPGFAAVPGKTDLCAALTRIMLPFLPLVSLAAVAMGMLNAQERFGPPALAPSMFNLVTIAAGFLFWSMELPPAQVVVGWSVAVLAGGLAQYAVQLPPLRQQGWRFSAELNLADPGLRRILRLMGPATLGLAAVQVNIFIGSIFASKEEAAVSWLNYAFRVLYLPIGIFGVAIGTIATTGLARHAAQQDVAGMRRTLGQALRLVGFLTIPSTLGLMVVGRPIIRLLYQHGRFTARDTDATAMALFCYAFGLFAYSAVKVLAPALYALDRPRMAVAGSLASVATNLLANVTLYPWIGYRGVAIGTSLGAVVNSLFLWTGFRRLTGRSAGDGRLAGEMGRVMLAALVMGAAAWASKVGLERSLGTETLAASVATCLLPIVVGLVVYAGCARLLRIEELDDVLGLLRRRLSRGR